MISSLKQLNLENYNFPEITNLKKVSLRGLMNENYTFISLDKQYFVKVYKYYSEAKVEISHALITYLISRDIKTYHFIKSRNGKTFCNENNMLFDISEFINDATNRIEEKVSKKILEEMASGLAKYHDTVVNCGIGLDFVNVFSPDRTKTSFQSIEKIVSSKDFTDDFDNLCLVMVKTKLNYIEKIPRILNKINFNNFPILINHGDFLTGNCLFDSKDNLRYIIDFEHIIKTYRVWDVIKTSTL